MDTHGVSSHRTEIFSTHGTERGTNSTHRNIYSGVSVRKTTNVINIQSNHSLERFLNENYFAFINAILMKTEEWMTYVILGPDSDYFLLLILLSTWTFCAFKDTAENLLENWENEKLWSWSKFKIPNETFSEYRKKLIFVVSSQIYQIPHKVNTQAGCLPLAGILNLA